MITLRLDKNGGINKGDVQAFEHDNKSEVYIIQLYKNGEIYDLTNKNIELTMVERKRKIGDMVSLPIYEATEGKVKLEVVSDITKQDGIYDFKLTVKDTTGLIETFPNFQVKIENDITDSITGEIIQDPNFTILTEGLKALADYNIYKTNALKVPEIEQDIIEINSQLDTNMNYTKEISINVKMLGAIGDDKLHLLSEKFTTLEEAQKVYPSATSLNDSIDSVAIQKAIDSYNIEIYSGGVPKNGGIVYIPMGQYRLNKTIKMKKGIQLIGCGTGGTYLSWSALNIIGIEYEEDAESTSIKDLTILDVANGILIRTSNYCNFERLALHGCYNNGIEIQNGVCNTFEGIKITGSRYGIYFNTQMGSTTQYFKDIHISRATHTGFRIEGNEYGLSQCILENVICEYCGVYGIYMDCNTWHTRSNIFKRIWLEGNADYGFYYKNGNYGTLDEIYADPGTNQTVLVEGGECVNIKNVQGNLNITSSQTYYIDGYVSGSESYTHPNKMVRFNKDNYKKYTSDNTTAILVNAWAYITGDTSGKAEGIFLVTVKDKEVGIRDYKTVIYNFKAGEYIEKTELSGTMGVVENEGGTVANAYGREVIITIELLSTMTPH